MFVWIQHYYLYILISLFGLFSLINILYYLLIFARFSFHKSKRSKDFHQDPVSIIICAKNDAHNLIKSLPELLSQQYNQYEVVVINDNSNDETEQVIRDFMSQDLRVKLVNLTSSVTNIQGKKFPISIGIKSASYELLLLTDPDCIPSSPYWLQNMAKHFHGKTEIVLGYNAFEKRPGLLNRLIHFDTLHTAIQYFSYALAKIPYMGNGKNLAYTKELFFRKKGFASHNHINYGSDDLFVNRAATKNNCDIDYFPGAFTISRPKSRLREWFTQKKQYLYTFRFYKRKHKSLLISYVLSCLLFYISFGFALACSISQWIPLIIVLGIFVIRIGIQHLIFGKAAVKLQEKATIPFILLFDILFSVLTPILYIAALFSSRKK